MLEDKEEKTRTIQPFPEVVEEFRINPTEVYSFTIHYGMNTAPRIVEKKGKDLDANELLLMYGDWLVRNGLR